ncbi:NPC intracellular cholesterol transporter 2 [Pseudolycoriella hygida]|uniref:NPC intracellular cholesterol transporter 2 n=1 Tax=Pseudolycoriella hygida TaxID=35572 RepID=A0A9Q0NCC7_9DIPT|nr:NPC intracellular cholesterol transporter 2 [Pseudolycoriella hygida]
MKLLLSVVFTLFVSSAVGEVIKHSVCSDEENQCTIHAVRVNPCPQAADNNANPCHIKRGRSASIDFDYTAGFDATNGKGEVFWMSAEGDLPFLGMDSNACSFTQCPIKKDERKTYSQTFETKRKYPARIFDIKWKLSNADNPQEFCCFVMKIKLTK